MERDSAGVVTKAWLFIAVRRGGRFIYALDVTTPTAPKFMWRKGCTTAYPDNSGCDSGFTELGQTWSQPVVVKTNANSGNPIVFLGGGYDNISEDTEPPATIDVVGRAVYALDAASGTPIWSAVKTGASAPARHSRYRA